MHKNATQPDSSFDHNIVYASSIYSQVQVQTGVDESGEPVYGTYPAIATTNHYDVNVDLDLTRFHGRK